MRLYVKHGPDKVYLSVTAKTRVELAREIGNIFFEVKGKPYGVNEVQADIEKHGEIIGGFVGAFVGGLIFGPLGMIIGAAIGLFFEKDRQERRNQEAIKFNQSPMIKTFKIEEDT